MLSKAKTALRITADDYDDEIQDLIDAALADLGLVGIDASDTSDALIVRAVMTYCRLNFSSPGDYDKLKASYDEQKAQLKTATGYGRAADSVSRW